MSKTTPVLQYVLVISILSLLAGWSDAKDNKRIEPPQEITDFSLVDHHGKPFGPAELKDKWSIIFIGFTSCPDVCPATLANLEAVRADMSVKMRPETVPNIIFLAVDPQRDTDVLEQYLGFFHPQYIGITGQRAEIDRLVDDLDGFYRINKKSEKDSYYDVVHTATVSIINPKGQLVAQISPPFKPESTGEYLTQLIRAEKRLAREASDR